MSPLSVSTVQMRMNAINAEMVSQLDAAFTEAESKPEVRAIVIAGKGKGFIAGADIRFFVKNIEKDDLPAIQAFTEAGQRLLDRFGASKKTVIARLDGLFPRRRLRDRALLRLHRRDREGITRFPRRRESGSTPDSAERSDSLAASASRSPVGSSSAGRPSTRTTANRMGLVDRLVRSRRPRRRRPRARRGRQA